MSMTTNFTINKSELKSLIGPGKIFFRDDPEFDETTFLSFGTDRTKVYQPDFNILAFPTTTEEVDKNYKIRIRKRNFNRSFWRKNRIRRRSDRQKQGISAFSFQNGQGFRL